MLLKMFLISDTKAGIFYPPMFKATHGEAERDFANLINEPNTTLNRNPEDFDLHYLGEYDNSCGKMTTLATPQHLQKAIFLLKKTEEKTPLTSV